MNTSIASKFKLDSNNFIIVKRFDEMEGIDQHTKQILNSRIEEVALQY
jgi:protein gp37